MSSRFTRFSAACIAMAVSQLPHFFCVCPLGFSEEDLSLPPSVWSVVCVGVDVCADLICSGDLRLRLGESLELALTRFFFAAVLR